MTQRYSTYNSDNHLPDSRVEIVDDRSIKESISNTLQKWILIFLVFAVMLAAVLGITLAFFIVSDGRFFFRNKLNETTVHWKAASISTVDAILPLPNVDNSSSCDTKECFAAADIMRKYIDPQIDPCDDFYQFACGKYLKEAEIPNYQFFVNPKDEVKKLALDGIAEGLRHPDSNDSGEALKAARIFYQSCLKEDHRDLKTLKELLEDFGGWPVVEGDQWESEKGGYQELLSKMAEHGISNNFIFSVFIDTDMKNPEGRKIYIDQPEFGMASTDYLLRGLEDTKVEVYLAFQSQMADLLGAKGKAAEDELKEALSLEIKLANVSQRAEERRNESQLYNPMSLKKLQKITQNISWKEYLEKVLSLDQISEDEEVIVMCPEYLKAADKILNETSSRIKVNYLIWRVILGATEYLSSPEVSKISLKYREHLYGITEELPRNQFCSQSLTRNFPLLAVHMMHQRAKNQLKVSSAEEIVDYVQIELKTMLQNNSWIKGDAAKTMAKTKMSSIKYLFAGTQERIFEREFLDKYYKKLSLSESDSFWENRRKLVLFKRDKLSGLHQEGRFEDASVLMENRICLFKANYQLNSNTIRIPVTALFDGQWFEPNGAKYQNFGTLGNEAGVAFNHALDDLGRQYTNKGVLEDWWDKPSLVKYKEKMLCIARQYKHFFEDEKINSQTRKSRGNNWSDLGGLQAAYEAYQKWVQENTPEKALPGLNHTANQFFWLSYAQKFCTKTRNFTEYVNTVMAETSFAPQKFRVNGPLQNLKEFSEDWHCSADAKMNVENKCSIW